MKSMFILFGISVLLFCVMLSNQAYAQSDQTENRLYVNEEIDVYFQIPDGWEYVDLDRRNILVKGEDENFNLDFGYIVLIYPNEFKFPSLRSDIFNYRGIDFDKYSLWTLPEGISSIPGDAAILGQNQNVPIIEIKKYSVLVPDGLNEKGLLKHLSSKLGKSFLSLKEKPWGWELIKSPFSLTHIKDHDIDSNFYYFKDGSIYSVIMYTPEHYNYDELGTNQVFDTLVIKGFTVPEFYHTVFIVMIVSTIMIILSTRKIGLSFQLRQS